jgi:hypothetical protein
VLGAVLDSGPLADASSLHVAIALCFVHKHAVLSTVVRQAVAVLLRSSYDVVNCRHATRTNSC